MLLASEGAGLRPCFDHYLLSLHVNPLSSQETAVILVPTSGSYGVMVALGGLGEFTALGWGRPELEAREYSSYLLKGLAGGRQAGA